MVVTDSCRMMVVGCQLNFDNGMFFMIIVLVL